MIFIYSMQFWSIGHHDKEGSILEIRINEIGREANHISWHVRSGVVGQMPEFDTRIRLGSSRRSSIMLRVTS